MDLINTLIRLRIIPLLEKWNIINLVLGIIDIMAIAVAFQFAYLINYHEFGGNFFFERRDMTLLFLGILPVWLITLYIIKVTEIPRTKRYRTLLFEYLQSAIAVSIILLAIYFIFKLAYISRLFLIEFTFLGFLFLFMARTLEYKVFRIYRAKGYNYINVVLIADDSSIGFIEDLRNNLDWGYRIAFIFSNSQNIREKYGNIYKILPEKSKMVLHELMEVDTIDEVIYLKNEVFPAEVRNTIRSCEELGVVFRLRHKDLQLNLTNAFTSMIGNEKFLTFINIPYKPFALAVKKFMDINFSVILLIILSPFMLLISLAIKLTSEGPVIYKQARVGLRGRQFNLYKFRTMVVNADKIREELESQNEADGPVFKIKDDPRITKIGKLLRKTGLDELPQLFNVLKGEMSLIGPRPPLKSETEQYKRWQLRRLSVKPGLSCFWQIIPDRNSVKFEKWMEMDLAYIDNWSPRLDFIILFKTIKTVFNRTGN
ncbi:MAG: exopolysaccharide biosynthesis polyprenyl glycosylphosphotransferase [Bacteroidales bacterium]|nr:exopolysaccharide biosynthesis polyprenyl glycosylphosphotransferase [Bacteroidales bacterium]HQG76856.1 sugar transferase [Bacteroidales bacterium]